MTRLKYFRDGSLSHLHNAKPVDLFDLQFNSARLVCISFPCLQVEALHSVHVCTYEMIQYFNSPKHQGELVKVGTHYATRSMHVYMYNT